jgi:DHA1 family inner membrane transport protein
MRQNPISPFSNFQVHLLIWHSTLHRLAWNGSGLFSAIFMLQQGISAKYVFLTFSGILFLRYLLRPLTLSIVPAIGLRNALIVGTLLQAAQYPLLASISGKGSTLYLFGLVSALGGMIYYTCYHAMFAIAGDVAVRGRQVAIRQVLVTGAAIVGPAFGGLALSLFGPWIAFGAATAIEVAAIVPLTGVEVPKVSWPSRPPRDPGMKAGALLFATDGWINHSSGISWNIIVFLALGTRFDTFGAATAAAALAGALGGTILGHVIDSGYARGATRLNASVLIGILLLKAFCGNDAVIVTAVAIGTYMIGGIYTPSLMTALYNESKLSPDPLRFQISAEGGWDLGAGTVDLIAAALCALGMPFQAVILLALPAVLVQARALERSYARSRRPSTTP